MLQQFEMTLRHVTGVVTGLWQWHVVQWQETRMSRTSVGVDGCRRPHADLDGGVVNVGVVTGSCDVLLVSHTLLFSNCSTWSWHELRVVYNQQPCSLVSRHHDKRIQRLSTWSPAVVMPAWYDKMPPINEKVQVTQERHRRQPQFDNLLKAKSTKRWSTRSYYTWLFSLLKGHSGAELHIYVLVRLESIYYQIFFYSKIVPNCAVAK